MMAGLTQGDSKKLNTYWWWLCARGALGNFSLLPRRKHWGKKRDLFASSFAVSRYGAGSLVDGLLSTSGKRIPKKPEARMSHLEPSIPLDLLVPQKN